MSKYIEEIIANRGYSKEELYKTSPQDLNWKELTDISNSVFLDIFYKNLYKNICVLYDPDVDGLFAGFIMEDYLKRAKAPANLFRFMNKNKVHGWSKDLADYVNENKIDLLFVVDAGSSDTLKFYETIPNTRVVILDHHDFENHELPSDNKISRLNVQDYDYLPRLSGCGMTYRFIRELNKATDIYIDFYEVFVGITVISDVCSMLDSENRYYVSKTYANKSINSFLEYFSKNFFYGSNLSLFGFKVIPYLNALIRVNQGDLAMKIVNNMQDVNLPKFIESNFKKVKDEQDVEIDSIINNSQLIEGDGFVVLLRKPFGELKTLNGLVANKLMSKFKKSALVMVLSQDENGANYWRGSFRGFDFSNNLLENYNFECHGHAKACGVSVYPKDLRTFCSSFEYLPEDNSEYDLAVSLSDLNNDNFCYEIAQFNEYASGDVPPIKLKITDPITSDSIKKYPMGNTGKAFKLYINGVSIIDFTDDSENRIASNDLFITINLNKYSGYSFQRLA